MPLPNYEGLPQNNRGTSNNDCDTPKVIYNTPKKNYEGASKIMESTSQNAGAPPNPSSLPSPLRFPIVPYMFWMLSGGF